MVLPKPPLIDDERVLWEGAPPTGLRFYAHDKELVPFSILWVSAVVFWNIDAWTTGQGPGAWFMRLWGLPFLLLGAFQLVGRFFLDAAVRRRQRYYVTERRVLVVRYGWRGRVIATGLDFLPIVTVTERSDGSGDIRFGLKRYRRTSKTRQLVERDRVVPALNPTPQFLGVPNVRAVQELIEYQAQRAGGIGA